MIQTQWDRNEGFKGYKMIGINKVKQIVLGGVMTTILCSPAFAGEFSYKLGAAVIGSQDYVIGEDNELLLVPYGEFEYGMFKLDKDGLTATYDIDDSHSISAGINQRRSSFDRSDNKILKHFDKRDSAIEMTAKWMFSVEDGDISLSATGDVSDTHNGYEIGVEYSKNMMALNGLVIPSVSLTLQSEELVDYYYGVNASEATANIAAYKGKESLTAKLAVTHIYSLTENWSTFTNVGWQYLGSGITDSSIVKKDNVWTVVFGAVYDF